MKTFRIWLLVLLAALLPVRGVVAAAMLCPPASMSGQSTTASTGIDHHMMDEAGPVAHEHAEHQHPGHDVGSPGPSGHPSDGHGKCNLCCDFCSMTPLLSALPSVAAPLNLSSVPFPDLHAPAPSFLSDGQERPPRSI